VLKLQAEIHETIAKAEAAGEEGDVDEAQDLMDKAEVRGAHVVAGGMTSEADVAAWGLLSFQELKKQKAELQGKIVADAVAKGLSNGSSGKAQHSHDWLVCPWAHALTYCVCVGSGMLQLPPGADVNQKLRVCEICGAFLSISDNDRRLADHFGGQAPLASTIT
jgi:hypothetical protein